MGVNKIFLVVLLALVIRIAAILSIDDPQRVPRSLAESDAPTYYVLSQNLISGIGYRYTPDGEPTAKRTPGYPIFIAMIFKVFGKNFNAVRVAQAILDAITTAMVFILTNMLFGNKRTSMLASTLYAIYPPAILMTTYILTETLYTFLLVASLVTLVWALIGKMKSMSLTSGIIFGLSNLTRPVAIFLPFVLAAIGIALRKEAWKYLLIFCIATLIPLMPWASRNKQALGKTIVTCTVTGSNLYRGNHLPTRGAAEKIEDVITPELQVKLEGLSEAQRDSVFKAEAIRMILENKKEIAILALKKIPRLWLNLGYGRKPSNRSIAVAILHTIMITLALYGCFWNKINIRYIWFVPLSVIITSSVAYLAVSPVVRSALPLVPLMLPFTGEGLRKVTEALRK